MACFAADFIDVSGTDYFQWYASAAEMLRETETALQLRGYDLVAIFYADNQRSGGSVEITPTTLISGRLERGANWSREDCINIAELLSRFVWDDNNEYWVYKEV